MRLAFIDTNIPVYAAGTEHSFREPAREIVRSLRDIAHTCWADAEVLQELTNLYLRRGQLARGRTVIQDFDEV